MSLALLAGAFYWPGTAAPRCLRARRGCRRRLEAHPLAPSRARRCQRLPGRHAVPPGRGAACCRRDEGQELRLGPEGLPHQERVDHRRQLQGHQGAPAHPSRPAALAALTAVRCTQRRQWRPSLCGWTRRQRISAAREPPPSERWPLWTPSLRTASGLAPPWQRPTWERTLASCLLPLAAASCRFLPPRSQGVREERGREVRKGQGGEEGAAGAEARGARRRQRRRSRRSRRSRRRSILQALQALHRRTDGDEKRYTAVPSGMRTLDETGRSAPSWSAGSRGLLGAEVCWEGSALRVAAAHSAGRDTASAGPQRGAPARGPRRAVQRVRGFAAGDSLGCPGLPCAGRGGRGGEEEGGGGEERRAEEERAEGERGGGERGEAVKVERGFYCLLLLAVACSACRGLLACRGMLLLALTTSHHLLLTTTSHHHLLTTTTPHLPPLMSFPTCRSPPRSRLALAPRN